MKKGRGLLSGSVLFLMIGVVSHPAAGQDGLSRSLPEVVAAARHDTSPPLRSIPVNRNRPRQSLNKAVPTYRPSDLIYRHKPTARVKRILS